MKIQDLYQKVADGYNDLSTKVKVGFAVVMLAGAGFVGEKIGYYLGYQEGDRAGYAEGVKSGFYRTAAEFSNGDSKVIRPVFTEFTEEEKAAFGKMRIKLPVKISDMFDAIQFEKCPEEWTERRK